MKPIVGGLIAVGLAVILMWVYHFIKALKDPDVRRASELGMDVSRYRRYRKWYDEHQRLMSLYGIESKEAEDYFVSFFRQIKYPNEWRRYQRYRENTKV